MQGVVSNYFAERGYGFIQGDDGQEYFFRREAVVSDTGGRTDTLTTVLFEPRTTSRGYRAERVRADDRPDTRLYEYPDKMVLGRRDGIPGWDILERSRWIVSASSSQSPDAAWRALAERARHFGANAIIQGEYWRTKGNSGNYQFSIHHARGRLVIIGRRSTKGRYTRTTPGQIESRVLAQRGILQRRAEARAASRARDRIVYRRRGAAAVLIGLVASMLGAPRNIDAALAAFGVLWLMAAMFCSSAVCVEDDGLIFSPESAQGPNP